MFFVLFFVSFIINGDLLKLETFIKTLNLSILFLKLRHRTFDFFLKLFAAVTLLKGKFYMDLFLKTHFFRLASYKSVTYLRHYCIVRV